ncbi:MAG: ACT domain-containing protein [Oscillospiraceae bacterium]|nr:ACT domain-containing protein [Oscillospiraceae bacterium]
MRAVITVIGRDRVGIIAGICTELAALGVNVLDISQTILQDVFTMNMLVDLAGSTADFAGVADAVEKRGAALGVRVHIQREDIFDAMHKI